MMRENKYKETLLACLKNINFMIGFVMLLSVFFVAAFAKQIAPYSYTQQGVGSPFTAPNTGSTYEVTIKELGCRITNC